MTKAKTLLILALVIAVFALLFIRVANEVLKSPRAGNSEGIACTADAMQCPDGSYVGRVPPTCDFAPCGN
jgi:hypothetical protein